MFQFSKGVEHFACTMDDPPNGAPWCKVGENSTHLIYEDCNMDTCKGKTYRFNFSLIYYTAECVGQLGTACIFPFVWQGIIYIFLILE